jgi:hypothetical protein
MHLGISPIQILQNGKCIWASGRSRPGRTANPFGHKADLGLAEWQIHLGIKLIRGWQ